MHRDTLYTDAFFPRLSPPICTEYFSFFPVHQPCTRGELGIYLTVAYSAVGQIVSCSNVICCSLSLICNMSPEHAVPCPFDQSISSLFRSSPRCWQYFVQWCSLYYRDYLRRSPELPRKGEGPPCFQPLTYISSIKGLKRRSAGDVVSPGNALPPALRWAGVLLQGSNLRSGSRLNLSVPLMLGSALAIPLAPRASGAREGLRAGRPMMPPFGVPSERNTSKVSWLP